MPDLSYESPKLTESSQPLALDYRLFFFILLVFLGISCIRLQWSELSHGDDWSDASVMIAGENFARLGFPETHFLPIFRPDAISAPASVRPDAPDWTNLSVFGTYTRVPPIFNWVAGIVYPYFGDASLLPYRIMTVAISGIGVVAFFLLIHFLFRSSRLACICSLLYISNPYFIANFDSLHQHVYMDAMRNVSLLAISGLFISHDFGWLKAWVLAWFSLLLLSLAAYEYLPWLTVTITGVALFLFLTKRKKAAFSTLLLGSAFAVGLILHFSLVALHYGSIHEALVDRLSNAAQRISGNANLLGSAGAFSWATWWQVVALRFPAQVSVIGWAGGFATILAGLTITLTLAKPSRNILLWASATGLFFCAGASIWYVIMPAHCVDHAGLSFLQKFLLPGISLMLAVPAEAALRALKDANVKSYVSVPLALALPIFIFFSGLMFSELPITPQKRESEREFVKIQQSLTELRGKFEYEDFIACNLMRPTWMMMYYTQARTIQISTLKQLEALPQKPKFFIFVPLNDQDTAELGKVIGNFYKIRSTCDNKRLPFYILERL